MQHQVHLVGGAPFSSAREVFEVTSRVLGPALPRIPDGEVGRPWMGWFAPVITENPFLQRTDEEFRPHPGGYATFRYVLKPGVTAQEVIFSNLPHAQVAIESYGVFQELKKAGVVRPEAKFLWTMAHPIPVIRRYFPEELQPLIEDAFERALLGEVRKVVEVVPASDLAIQWDCASAVFGTLERNEPSRFGRTKEEMYQPLAERLARFGRAAPAEVDLLYHFCYGNSAGKHSIEPSTTRDAVIMANRVQEALGAQRPIQLIHLPVPIDRDDDAYFAPLSELRLAPQSVMALGLVHLRDGLAGARRRIAAAQRHLPSFAIATECGLSHVPREQLLDVLALQADLAGVDQ